MPPPQPPAHPAAAAGPPPDWAAMRRVLLVRPDNLGDVLLCGPALRALRAAAPAARLDVLASPGGAAAAPLLPEVGEVLVERVVWQDAGGTLPQDPVRELALVERLRGYDAVIAATSFSQSPWPVAYAAYLAGVPVRIGQSAEFGGSLLSHWVTPPPPEGHQVDRQLHLLAAVGVPGQGRDLRVRLPDPVAHHGQLAAAGFEPGAPYAVVLPGASCPSRRAKPGLLAAVVARLRDELPVVVAGTPTERSLLEAVAGSAGTPVAGLSLPALGALLAGAAVAVTMNSGGMHLADAVRVPLVVLFAGTEQESQYSPRSTVARLLRVPTACAPCRAFVCPYAQECLDLDPDAVAAEALALARSGVAA